MIKNTVYGNIDGIKKVYLRRLERLYGLQIPSNQLMSDELLTELLFLSHQLNREIAVYISRRGQILQVTVGQHDKVALNEINKRVSTRKLSKIRCIHTHPNSSGFLSTVDINSLHQFRFDCIAAIGINNGVCSDIWVGFIKPEENSQTLQYGPFDGTKILNFDFLKVIRDIENSVGTNYQLTQDGKEKALLVGIEFTSRGSEGYDAHESLQELEGLAKAAGAFVVEKVFQSRPKPDSTFFIGSGLVESLKLKCQALNVNLVVIDGELSGSQHRNLEQSLGVKVVDRTGLILDIFAQRAKSKEGKLQVELAQLEYLLPKLIGGADLGLSRLAGGIGTRGPGESKLEQDRRRLRQRIVELKRELRRVENRRKILKANRDGKIPVIALVGYTNSGKSTLRYRLLQEFATKNVNWNQEDAGTNQLFATLDSTVREIALPNGTSVLLADTVGFIQRLPYRLVSAFKATLEEVIDADLLLHVVDVSSPNYEQQMMAVEQVLSELEVISKKTLIVYNKVDLIKKGQIYFNPNDHPTVEISALHGQGITKLLEQIQLALGEKINELRLAIPYTEQKLIAFVHREGRVKNVIYNNDYVILEAILNQTLCSQVEKYII